MKHPQQFLRDIEYANGGYDPARAQALLEEKAKYDRRFRHQIIAAAVLCVALMALTGWEWFHG